MEAKRHGIPTVVWITPILPFINDTEENLLGILRYCADSGVYGIIHFGMGVTLRDGDREYFYSKLDEHFPGLKQEYIRRYGYSYNIQSPNAEKLERIFHDFCNAYSIETDVNRIFAYLNEFPEKYEQLSLF